MTNTEPFVTIRDLPGIEKAYEQALRENKEVFTFPLECGKDGKFLVAYAKYLIEFLELAQLKHDTKS